MVCRKKWKIIICTAGIPFGLIENELRSIVLHTGINIMPPYRIRLYTSSECLFVGLGNRGHVRRLYVLSVASRFCNYILATPDDWRCPAARQALLLLILTRAHLVVHLPNSKIFGSYMPIFGIKKAQNLKSPCTGSDKNFEDPRIRTSFLFTQKLWEP